MHNYKHCSQAEQSDVLSIVWRTGMKRQLPGRQVTQILLCSRFPMCQTSGHIQLESDTNMLEGFGSAFELWDSQTQSRSLCTARFTSLVVNSSAHTLPQPAFRFPEVKVPKGAPCIWGKPCIVFHDGCSDLMLPRPGETTRHSGTIDMTGPKNNQALLQQQGW